MRNFLFASGVLNRHRVAGMDGCNFVAAAGWPASWGRWLALVFLALSLRAAPRWPAVDPAELAEAKPKIDPEAGVEILVNEVDLDQISVFDVCERHHVRAKIFSERGVDKFAKVDLPYAAGAEIRDVAARTIKPDGAVVELNPKDVFDREVVRSGDVRLKEKSFAPPGIVPGAIVEYRYTVQTGTAAMFVPMLFQGDEPVRRARYRLRPPQSHVGYTIRSVSFNCPAMPLKADHDDYYVFEMSNLPAAKLEPYQPPGIDTCSAILVYYSLKDALPPEKCWSEFAKELSQDLDSAARISRPIRAAVAGIVAPQDTDEVRLQKIYDFCRTKILNRDRETTKLTAEQRSKLRTNETPADTLKSGSGTAGDINLLFGALVRAAGMEARWAACNNRQLFLFNPSIAEPFMLSDWVIAVRLVDKWCYCDPGATYLPRGALPWADSDTAVLLADAKGAANFLAVPGGPPESTVRSRKADLRLEADGTIEGDVTESATGQLEASLKYALGGKSDAEREEFVQKEIQEYQKSAEVTAVRVSNAADPIASLEISYHLRIPEFADRSTTRIFFQPGVLQKGVPPKFESATRRSMIIFPYRFTERDEIHIKLPDGYALEEASAPQDLPMGKMADYSVAILLNRASRELTYQRTFTLKALAFATATYPAIKRAFELVHQLDNHTLALRQEAKAPARNAQAPGAAAAQPY